MLFVIFLICIALLSIIYLLNTSSIKLDHWKKQGVKYMKPLPLLGNMLPVLKNSISMADLIKNMYDLYPLERYVGFYQFTTPILLIRDPELIKNISIKHFENFMDHHTGVVSPDVDPLWGKNLLSSRGERWRDLRQTLSPAFTGSKMRSMFVLMDECAKQLLNYFKEQKDQIIDVEIKDVFSRYTNDIIASIAFGIKCDSLKSQNNEFLMLGKELTDFSGLKKFKFLLYGYCPRIAKFFKIKMVNDKIGNVFRSIINETIALREEKKIIRPDLIHLLMLSRRGKLKYEDVMNLPKTGFADVEESEIGRSNSNLNYLSNEDITAQAIIFFFAGFDGISSTMSFTAYELAVNPNTQKKLRKEIAQTQKKVQGSITYEQLLEMKYLDMVVCESLRKWPQGVWIDRLCTKTFEIMPERRGESTVKLNPGDIAWFPVFGIHRDPKYYPNPDIFDPERFNEENVRKLPSGTYLPFGTGPRNCIGSRFALLEIKVVLYYLLLDFEFVPTEKTQIPLKLKKDTALLLPENLFHLGLKPALTTSCNPGTTPV